MEKERIIVVDISLTKTAALLLVGILMMMAILVYATLSREVAEASHDGVLAAQSNGLRQFYLTQNTVWGDSPLIQCAEGYHFASLWEIADPSNLKYNHSLGLSKDDSGEGPPSGWDTKGWVRTGYASDSVGLAGTVNCEAWRIEDVFDSGTVVYLPSDWTAGEDDISVWVVEDDSCHYPNYVWCIED